MTTRATAHRIAAAAARTAARVVIATAVCAIVLTALRAPVEARVNAALLDLGAQMLRYQGAMVQDEPRTVSINGAILRVSAGATHDAMDSVLDAYARRCGDAAASSRGDDPAIPFGAPLRAGDDHRGFVACIGGGAPLSADSLVERIRGFVSSHDTTALGPMQYLYAERRGAITHFIALSARDGLDVGRILPRSGDAPGGDAAGITRPPASRRRLSLRELGTPYGITVYGGSPRSIAQLEDYYRDRLAADGWRILRGRPTREILTGESHLAVVRDGALAFVVFGDEPSGTSTTILTTTFASRAPRAPERTP